MSCVTGLDRLPEVSHAHIWADWAELLCLTSADSSLARGELDDRMQEREEIEGEIDADTWRGAREDEPDLPPVTLGDRHRRYVTDIFAQLQYRHQIFGGDYPFEFSDTRATLSLRRLTNRRMLYLFLLLSASQRYIALGRRRSLTDAFERTAADAIRSLLPDSAEMHLFGTSAPPGSRYRGLLHRKIERLAGDLGDRPLVSADDFATNDRGDGGLDIVGWVPVGDRLGARLILFGQATCTLQWRLKQSEAGFDRWRRRIDFAAQPRSVMCIPFSYRTSSGAWHRRLEIEDVVFLDRERMMWLLPGDRRRQSVPYDLVEEASQQAIPAFS